jgi:hypothetical protein
MQMNGRLKYGFFRQIAAERRFWQKYQGSGFMELMNCGTAEL